VISSLSGCVAGLGSHTPVRDEKDSVLTCAMLVFIHGLLNSSVLTAKTHHASTAHVG
jgi:hypothetical protein